MDTAARPEEPSIESEFARTYKLVDLYIQQKTDLFLQHYVFEPFNLLISRIMILSIIVTLLAVGTLFLWMGIILLIVYGIASLGCPAYHGNCNFYHWRNYGVYSPDKKNRSEYTSCTRDDEK